MKKRIIAFVLIFSALLVLPGCITFKAEPAAGNTSDDLDGTEGISDSLGNDPAEDSAEDAVKDTVKDNAGGTVDKSSGDVTGLDQDSEPDGLITNDGSAAGASYKLKEPEFIKLGDISLCQVAEDYINLPDEEFNKRYPDEKLWKFGAFDRLLFTKNSKGKIVGNIGIGSTLQQVIDTFGSSQFGTADTIYKSAVDYKRYLLYGYKTRDFYFAFRIDPETKLVDSICFRKRHALPDDKKDMLVVLSKFGDWYGADYTGETADERMDQWDKYIENDRVELTQWGRGTMTMICDYGFTSTSGMGLDYGVYADYTGDIPILPARQSEWDEGTYEPLTVFDLDYPEWMIYRIYNYLAEQEDAIKYKNGLLSPDKSIFAYAVEGDWLDMRSSGLYEWAHVVFHSMDGKHPDNHEYFGHYSSLVGFIGDRYFVETNMMGLHVVDLNDWSIVYREDTVEGEYDLKLDEAGKRILDAEGNIKYTYKLKANGDIIVTKSES